MLATLILYLQIWKHHFKEQALFHHSFDCWNILEQISSFLGMYLLFHDLKEENFNRFQWIVHFTVPQWNKTSKGETSCLDSLAFITWIQHRFYIDPYVGHWSTHTVGGPCMDRMVVEAKGLGGSIPRCWNGVCIHGWFKYWTLYWEI